MLKRARLESLQGKHAELEDILHQELVRPSPDTLLIQQLKKQKLALRDEIADALAHEPLAA